jgi:hypothetical protein
MRVAGLLLCLILLPLSFNIQGVMQANQHLSGLPLGPMTDAFSGIKVDQQQLPTSASCQEDTTSLADLNRDGKCDRKDLKLFRKVLGKCVRVGSSAMVVEVDYDLDGCVTQKDRRVFLGLWQSCKNASERNK